MVRAVFPAAICHLRRCLDSIAYDTFSVSSRQADLIFWYPQCQFTAQSLVVFGPLTPILNLTLNMKKLLILLKPRTHALVKT